MMAGEDLQTRYYNNFGYSEKPPNGGGLFGGYITPR